MRKILLATTALAAFAGFASAANAQITVTLGGYTEFFGAVYDDDDANRTSREFQLETEIVVKADGKADNGLLYGAKVELQNGATTSVATDEASIYLSGFWGRVDLGEDDGVADRLAIFAPLVGVGSIDGDYADFVTVTPAAGTGAGAGLIHGRQPWGVTFGAARAPDSSDATKVSYVTPRVSGFQAGFSYVPENGDEGQSVVAFENQATYSDFLEFGINYTGDFSGVTVAASATGTSGNGKGTTGPTATAAAFKNFTAWQVGGQVGYAGFKVGGGYVDADDFNVTAINNSGDQHAWNAGASYTTGPIAVGVSFIDAEGYKVASNTNNTYAEEYQAYGVSGAYTVAPGLVVQSDLMFFDEELKAGAAATTKVGNDGYVWLISTFVTF